MEKGEIIMSNTKIVGYKGFDDDMTCRDFQYEVGQTYEMVGRIKLCERGFHFCRNMADVMEHYGREDCRYAEVEAFGGVLDDGSKSVTNKLHIIRELTWAEVLEIMYTQERLDSKDISFPAGKIIRERKNGTLGKALPSGTEFPVTFASGEKNILVVCRDRDHTYLVTKYLMAESFAMNDELTNKDGWPACGMRQHVQSIYDMLPEDIRRIIIPMHIRQIVQNKVAECDDLAFLLSAVNVFGRDAWYPEIDCEDSQIDIFRKLEDRAKRRVGASSTSEWWLRSALGTTGFCCVYTDGIRDGIGAYTEGGVAVGFCIEDRG